MILLMEHSTVLVLEIPLARGSTFNCHGVATPLLTVVDAVINKCLSCYFFYFNFFYFNFFYFAIYWAYEICYICRFALPFNLAAVVLC